MSYTAWRGRPLPTDDHPATPDDRNRYGKQDASLATLEAALGLIDDSAPMRRLIRTCAAGHPMRSDPSNVRLDWNTGDFHCKRCEAAGLRTRPEPVALCRRGRHPRTPENTGSRGRCLPCQRAYMAQRYRDGLRSGAPARRDATDAPVDAEPTAA